MVSSFRCHRSHSSFKKRFTGSYIVYLLLLDLCQGCLIAPTLSIGSVLLQQAAISASFHYNNVEIVESRADSTVITKSQ